MVSLQPQMKSTVAHFAIKCTVSCRCCQQPLTSGHRNNHPLCIPSLPPGGGNVDGCEWEFDETISGNLILVHYPARRRSPHLSSSSSIAAQRGMRQTRSGNLVESGCRMVSLSRSDRVTPVRTGVALFRRFDRWDLCLFHRLIIE